MLEPDEAIMYGSRISTRSELHVGGKLGVRLLSLSLVSATARWHERRGWVDSLDKWCHYGISMSTTRSNQSIQCGIRCLALMAGAGQPLGSREMARRLGLEHTRVNRALGTLEQLGLAAKTENRKYRPGPAIHVLAAQSLRGSGLLSVALSELRSLHDDGCTVALGVLWEKQVCYLVHANPGEKLDESIGKHELWPAEQSSLGVVLLADARPPARGESSRRPSEQSVPVAHLEKYLSEVRDAGMSRLRYPDGTVSMAVPVGGKQVVGAMGLSVTNPNAKRRQEVRSALIEVGRRVTERIGRLET